MKKLMFVALTVASTAAFAHDDVTAKADGFYDVTLTTKRLAHAEKVVSKTFTTSSSKGSAYDQCEAYMAGVTNYAGFALISGGITADTKVGVKKISVKFSYFDFKEDRLGNKTYVTKVVSESNKGVYDAKAGNVYLWDSKAKISVTSDDAGAIVEPKMKKDIEVAQSGYVAYEVPLAMDKQFVATDDNKAAGGFIGGENVATDGTVLDFNGFTAFGTGTIKGEVLNAVAGNVAMKTADPKFGAYGTWKIQKDNSAKTKTAKTVKDVLRNKGCVELFMERN